VPGTIWAFLPRNLACHKEITTKFSMVRTIYSGRLTNDSLYTWCLNTNIEQHEKIESTLFLEEKHTLFDARMMYVELKQLVRKYIRENEKLEIICLAKAAGHKVLVTLPYYSNLQLIELAWAYVKGKVGKQYSIDTTLQIVY
jgi:hypothetical protein